MITMTRTEYLRALTARFGYHARIPAEFMTAGELLEILEEMEVKHGITTQDHDRDNHRAGCTPDGGDHRDCINYRRADRAAVAIAAEATRALNAIEPLLKKEVTGTEKIPQLAIAVNSLRAILRLLKRTGAQK